MNTVFEKESKIDNKQKRKKKKKKKRKKKREREKLNKNRKVKKAIPFGRLSKAAIEPSSALCFILWI